MNQTHVLFRGRGEQPGWPWSGHLAATGRGEGEGRGRGGGGEGEGRGRGGVV